MIQKYFSDCRPSPFPDFHHFRAEPAFARIECHPAEIDPIRFHLKFDVQCSMLGVNLFSFPFSLFNFITFRLFPPRSNGPPWEYIELPQSFSLSPSDVAGN
jgi:hypothetical protein